MKVENLLYSNEFKVEIEGGERVAGLVKSVHFDFVKGEVRLSFYETKRLDVLKFLQEWKDNGLLRDMVIWVGDETRGIRLMDCMVVFLLSFEDLGNMLFEYDEDDIEEGKGYIVEVAVLLKFSKFEIVEKDGS
jgi:hypothetical protein